MPPFLSEILSQVKAIWARLDAGQRLTVSVVLLATVAGLGGIIWFAGRPDYQAVYSSLEPRELMQASQALDRGGVSYKLAGSAITVEGGDVAAARRALNSAGLGSSASETGSIASMTSDRATKTQALARMLEHDAERKMMAIRGVVRAQVSHSKPKRSPYRELDNETQPRANIGLQLRAGVSFTAVAKIASQDASAALGIPPEFITVTNLSTMQTYARDQEDGAAMDTNEFLRQQRQRSEELTQQAQSMLDRAFPHKALVRVTVVLDPEWKVLSERGAPEKQLIKRIKTTKDNTQDGGPVSAADPSSATGSGTIGTRAGAGTSKKSETKETEYAGDGYRETKSGRLAPDIKQMTVALIVDEEVIPDAAVEKQIESLVKSSIGWSTDWNQPDAFTIVKTKIPDVPELADPGTPAFAALVERYGPMAGQVLAVLLVLLFLRGLLKKSTPPAAKKLAPASGAAELSPELELSGEDRSRKMRREIEEAITTDPSSVTRLLESWLLEAKS